MEVTQNTTTKSAPLTFFSLTLVLVISAMLRAPMIYEGLPYFYNEDEAHHFNRVVNMVKSGDLNPNYFHKPSLHFYLRMPVAAASFINEVRNGRAKKLKDIRTRDSYGIADYAFTASHPGMVKWNRALSVFLSLLIVCFAFLITQHLTRSVLASSFAGLACGLSPDLIRHSAVVGVDTLMTCMCMASVWLACHLHKHFSPFRLFLVGVVAGLAISSKYNAAPIAALPLVAALLSGDDKLRDITIALFSPALGFFLGSPFILVSIPLFLDQLAYEVWHYGIAGHVGHMSNPGVDQALFYLKWLTSSALGVVTLALAPLGLLVGIIRPNRQLSIIILSFPLLFAALMISQKANFTRNMIAIIPFVSIFAALFLSLVSKPRYGVLLAIPLFIGALVFPAKNTRDLISEVLAKSDTRTEFVDWFSTAPQSTEKGIAGQILPPPHIYAYPNTSAFNQKVETPESLYLAGYDLIAFGNTEPLAPEAQSGLKLEHEVTGEATQKRIVENPHIWIYSFDKNLIRDRALAFLRDRDEYQISFTSSDCMTTFPASLGKLPENAEEPHCWAQSRIAQLKLPAGKVRFEVMSPWAENTSFTISGKDFQKSITLGNPGEWTEVSLDIPASIAHSLILEVNTVRSPASASSSRDVRRLGVALRGLQSE